MLQMVVVGDPSAVLVPLQAMNFGSTTLYDTLGQPAT
jgi:hypothetical protein